MRKTLRFLMCAALGLGLALAPGFVAAKTHHHAAHHVHHHRARHKARRHSGWVATRQRVRTAQASLAELDYRPGPTDGILGPQTRTALRRFQKDHRLHADGRLTSYTYRLLVNEAARTKTVEAPPPPPADFFATHPDFYGYYSPDYSNPVMLGSPQALPSRFGTLSISESGGGASRQYSVTLDGRPLLAESDQPAPLLVSRTYQVGDADAILVTAYLNNAQCPYAHALVVLRAQGHRLYSIPNCTRAPKAYVLGDSLFVRFPASNDNGPPTGALWRYEDGTLEKL